MKFNAKKIRLALGVLPSIVMVLIPLKVNSMGEEPSFHDGGAHDHIYEINTRYNLYKVCENDFDGFASKISGNDYSYHSLRQDLQAALITRATSGEMAFKILTPQMPEKFNSKRVTLFYYSNINLTNREPFDIKVNGQPLLTFTAREDGTLKILENPGEGNANYILIKRDIHQDGVGVFRLTIPVSMLKGGESAQIEFCGHHKESQSWFMIFKAKKALEHLKIAAEKETSFSIRQIGKLLYIDAPAHFAGKQVSLVCDGKESAKVVFKQQGDLAKASVQMNSPKKSFRIVYGKEFLKINFKNGDGIIRDSEVRGEFLVHYQTTYKGDWSASISKLYKPTLLGAFTDFFDRRNENGKVSIINSSHQDIAWVDRPEVCIILRDTLLLTPVIRDAFIRPDYAFDVEDGLILREYLNRHPDAKDKITTLLNKKLLSVGATYNCPYEDMFDAEDLVRQLYLGKKWVKKTFGGYDSKVYWNVDVPGKTLQFPQILKKAGVDYMVISRHAKGMFNWESPDGSAVFTYSPGHYGNDLIPLSRDMSQKIQYGAEQVTYWDPFFQKSKNTTPLLSSADMIPAIDYSDFIDTWNNFENIWDNEGEEQPVYLPHMEVMTVDEFMPLAKKNAKNIKTIRGERPNVWVYIHGPAHHKAITASRQASKLLPAAEKFLSIANILDPLRAPYPFETFDEAWQSKIYPDHGWGGHDGDVTDGLFKEELVKSRALGVNLLEKGTGFIASQINTNEDMGIPVVLFNSLSWVRNDPVTFTIQLPESEAWTLNILNSEGSYEESQLNHVEHYENGSIKRANITFIATDVPSVGYKTYYVDTSSNRLESIHDKSMKPVYENEFYHITFGKGGLAQIYDKELKRNLFKPGSFLGGEIFTLRSVGNGAGEFGDIQQPDLEGFDKVGLHEPEWTMVENGDVYTTYRLRQAVLHAIVEQDVTIFHQLKRVFFETKLLNWSGELYREFRTAFPVSMDSTATIAYEVPFGTVKVGQDEIKTAGERYTPLCKDVHPRAIMDWISASDENMSIVLSSSVAAADWIDPTLNSGSPVLQHILLASRTSCHWEGNEYSQGGDHYFSSILTSNATGKISGTRIAEQHNDPISIILNPDKSTKASLPEKASFFSISEPNVIVTTIKKAEDSKKLIIRMYDAEGRSSDVHLSSFFDISKLEQTNLIEENPVPVSKLIVPKFAIETFSFDAKQ
ncbi:MAG: hypothetical protein DWQ02_08070 [Bacteroidetes bacterium]|nr:MAG: hypothetical protein DWQ02_08070 [Bacteroidota bacterium]